MGTSILQLDPAERNQCHLLRLIKMLRYASTVRCPDRRTLKSVNGEIESYLRIGVANLRKQTFLLVASYEKYGPFRSKKWLQGKPAVYESLENLHDIIHGQVGGEGHTGDIAYAGLGPVFWLHHT